MSIKQVAFDRFMVFNDKLSLDFCGGVNVLLGGNAAGKTTLLKALYVQYEGFLRGAADAALTEAFFGRDVFAEAEAFTLCAAKPEGHGAAVFVQDIGVAEATAQAQKRTAAREALLQKINRLIGGEIRRGGDGAFYKQQADGTRIPFINESSGFKKLGFLSLLIAGGQLKKGTVLFWDEPENSFNRELMPAIVEIILALAKDGVQVFIATHDYYLTRYVDVRKDKSVPVVFFNLVRSGGRILCFSSPSYLKLPDNLLEKASTDLFEAVVADSLEA